MTIRAYIQHAVGNRKGFTLLLMVALLTAFLSIGMGIVNILLGQVIIIGQAQESFKALYAADIAMERTLYRDRDPMQNVCGTINPLTGQSKCNEIISLPNGACYKVSVQLGPSVSCSGPSTRCIVVTGQDICGGSERFVRRSFDVKY